MNTFIAYPSLLLELLSDGIWHSREELENSLKINQVELKKQLDILISTGIAIISNPFFGYQLTKTLILLNQDKIVNEMNLKKFHTPFNLHLFTAVDSTNRYLKDLPVSSKLEICCSELQTLGRGRFGREWYSPFGENIYCSSRWNMKCDFSHLAGLSLVISLAVVATIKEYDLSQTLQVKWPNDILWNHKKLCGILVEILAKPNNEFQVIVGIGLNVNIDTEKHSLPDRPWCSLYEIFKRTFDRNLLITSLLIKLERYLDKFQSVGLEGFLKEWELSDYLKHKHISVTQNLNSITGEMLGITKEGLLILKNKDKTLHYLSSG
ncbi:MAG: biotin--[acetyl-CoA-carboxylase] ligase, partial [bacterium]|nr:biotin--[acetyl-CoA-carboxylase] ligase [bacterium]